MKQITRITTEHVLTAEQAQEWNALTPDQQEKRKEELAQTVYAMLEYQGIDTSVLKKVEVRILADGKYH